MDLIEFFRLFAVLVLISVLARLGIYLGGSDAFDFLKSKGKSFGDKIRRR